MGLYDGGDCTIKFIEAEYSFHTQSRGTSTDFPSPQGQGHIPGSTNTGLDKGENDFLGALRREAAGAGCLFSGFSHGQWVYIVKHPIDGEPCAKAQWEWVARGDENPAIFNREENWPELTYGPPAGLAVACKRRLFKSWLQVCGRQTKRQRSRERSISGG